MSKDLYSTAEQRLDTVGTFNIEAIKHWQAIKRANDYFTSEYLIPDVSYTEVQMAFELWLNHDYGIRLVRGEGGYHNYEIVDPDKYLLFVLKYVK